MKARARCSRREVHCHVLVREQARKMAESLYDYVMRDNEVYAEWKSVCPELTPETSAEVFVSLLWPKFVQNGAARATLAALLQTNMDEALKSQIYEALVLDSYLSRGRRKMRKTASMMVH